jgi:AcrR family transcriptional regulator
VPVKKQPDNYHHGNLREALIQAGLRSLQVEGVETLSLRKLAEQCGVSPAAPYAHFENKEALLDAMEEYVMVELTKALEQTARGYVGKGTLLLELGVTYVLFFFENPAYFTTLFSRGRHIAAIFEKPLDTGRSAKGMEAERQADPVQPEAPDVMTESDREGESQVANPAFNFFAELIVPKLAVLGLDKEKAQNLLIASWALVHGLSSIVCTKKINDKLRAEGRVEDRIRDILSSQRPNLPNPSFSHPKYSA